MNCPDHGISITAPIVAMRTYYGKPPSPPGGMLTLRKWVAGRPDVFAHHVGVVAERLPEA
jgi:hypothetical protein